MNTTTNPKALTMTTLGRLLDREFPPRETLITPWLRSAESVLLWAATGVGKSMLVNTLALAVAGGGKVAGWEARTPRKVLLVDGEMHIEDLRNRLKMLAGTVEGIDLEAARGNLVVLARQDQGAEVEFPDLATRDGQDAIMARAQRMGAELVILDNFSTLAEVADENEAAAMNPILSFLMRLKQANVACILVHHSGKSGDTYRGSSKLATTFEVILGLRQLSGLAGEGGAAFELRWEKFRGRRTAATRDAEMKLLTEADETQRWETKPSASFEMLAVVDAVRLCQYPTQAAVAAALKLTEVEVSRHKTRATTTGVISREEWRACLEAAKENQTPDNNDF